MLNSLEHIERIDYSEWTQEREDYWIREGFSIQKWEAFDISDSEVFVTHAKWKQLTDYTNKGVVCSNCGEECTYIGDVVEDIDYDWDEEPTYYGSHLEKVYQYTKYCPYCGAKMDKKED